MWSVEAAASHGQRHQIALEIAEQERAEENELAIRLFVEQTTQNR